MVNNFFKTGCFLLVTAFLLPCKQLMAQPFNLTESVQPVELSFTEYKKDGEEKPKGRISINTLGQDKDTMYYFIKGLSMYSPTYFALSSGDANADIKVNLCKENWHVFRQTGDVKGKNTWSSRFKTEGDFGMMVIANKKPARYALVVWTGDEMKIEMPSVFKAADSSDMNGGWFKKNRMIVIISVVALGVILFLLVKLKRKKS